MAYNVGLFDRMPNGQGPRHGVTRCNAADKRRPRAGVKLTWPFRPQGHCKRPVPRFVDGTRAGRGQETNSRAQVSRHATQMLSHPATAVDTADLPFHHGVTSNLARRRARRLSEAIGRVSLPFNSCWNLSSASQSHGHPYHDDEPALEMQMTAQTNVQSLHSVTPNIESAVWRSATGDPVKGRARAGMPAAISRDRFCDAGSGKARGVKMAWLFHQVQPSSS